MVTVMAIIVRRQQFYTTYISESAVVASDGGTVNQQC